jgi:hypothetical protein
MPIQSHHKTPSLLEFPAACVTSCANGERYDAHFYYDSDCRGFEFDGLPG